MLESDGVSHVHSAEEIVDLLESLPAGAEVKRLSLGRWGVTIGSSHIYECKPALGIALTSALRRANADAVIEDGVAAVLRDENERLRNELDSMRRQRDALAIPRISDLQRLESAVLGAALAERQAVVAWQNGTAGVTPHSAAGALWQAVDALLEFLGKDNKDAAY